MGKSISDILAESRKEFSLKNSDNAIKLAEEAVSISSDNDLKAQLAESLLCLAEYSFLKKSNIEVLEILFKAQTVINYLDDTKMKIRLYRFLGSAYLIDGELDKSFNNFIKAIKIANESGNEVDDPQIYMGLGTILSYKEAFVDSLEYYNKALALAKQNPEDPTRLKILTNLGCIYNLTGELDKADTILNQVIVNCKKNDLKNILAASLDELGSVYKKRGDKLRAVESWESASILELDYGYTYVTIGSYLNLAGIYLDDKKWDKSREYIDKATDICNRTNSDIDLIDIYKTETEFYEARGDYEKALEFHKKYFEINKKMSSTDNLRILKEVELEVLADSRDRILTLSKVGRAITESLDIDKIVMEIYNNIGSVFDFSLLALAVIDKDENSIKYKIKIEDGVVLENSTMSIDDYDSFGAYAVREDKTIVMNDIKTQWSKYVGELRYPKNDKMPNTAIFSPLKVHDEIIGLFSIQSYKTNAYNQDDLEVFNILASYIAIGLNNAIQAAEIETQNRALTILADHDELTSLKNRRAFNFEAGKNISWAERTKTPLSVLLLDLDFFKQVNDNYGHAAGDYILKEVANILKFSVKRDNDIVARFGGEEFVFFLGDSDIDGAKIVAESIRKEIEGYEFNYNGITIKLTVSVGIATSKLWIENEDLQTIIDRADIALYEAKNGGRNCVKVNN